MCVDKACQKIRKYFNTIRTETCPNVVYYSYQITTHNTYFSCVSDLQSEGIPQVHCTIGIEWFLINYSLKDDNEPLLESYWGYNFYRNTLNDTFNSQIYSGKYSENLNWTISSVFPTVNSTQYCRVVELSQHVQDLVVKNKLKQGCLNFFFESKCLFNHP